MRLILALALLILLVPSTQAQGPMTSLSVDGVSQKYLATGPAQLVPVQVTLTLSNLVCTMPATLRVAVTVTSDEVANSTTNTTDNRTFAITASPAELSFPIQQGAYGSNAGLPAARPYQGRQTTTLAVTAQNLTTPATVDAGYKLQFAGYSGTECRGNGAVPSANAEGSFKVDFPAAGAFVPEPGPKLPVPGAFALLALVAALVILRRRAA